MKHCLKNTRVHIYFKFPVSNRTTFNLTNRSSFIFSKTILSSHIHWKKDPQVLVGINIKVYIYALGWFLGVVSKLKELETKLKLEKPKRKKQKNERTCNSYNDACSPSTKIPLVIIIASFHLCTNFIHLYICLIF